MDVDKQEMKLDVIGQYYSSINTRKQSGVFALSVYIKESLQPEILQQAADDLMRRLPFMNGRLKYGFFHYKYEILKNFAKIVPYKEEHLFSDYYNKGSRHMIRIVYGEKHFTVKTTHSICDGRGLSKFTKALLVRYYELLGMKVDKGDIIDCNGAFDPEEAEDAPERFGKAFPKEEKETCTGDVNRILTGVENKSYKGAKKTNKELEKTLNKEEKKPSKEDKVFQIKYSRSSPRRILTKSFDASEIRKAAKEYQASVSEYLMAHILRAVEQERDRTGGKRRIIGDLPIDCRSFFPSKTLRSFVTAVDIVMPEEKNFALMVKQIKEQFKEITKEKVQEQLCEYQEMYHATRFVPRAIKVLYMKRMTRFEARLASTGLSNLGVMKLPAEIESRIERMAFPIALEQDFPLFFSSVTVGNTLTLTGCFREEGRSIVEEVIDRLENVRKCMEDEEETT